MNHPINARLTNLTSVMFQEFNCCGSKYFIQTIIKQHISSKKKKDNIRKKKFKGRKHISI